MKKVLLGTSALIAAGLLAAPASAAEKIKLGLGGKMEQYFGVISTEDTATTDWTSTGIWTDTEVYFSGATTLDNGLTVGAMIQLESQTNTGTPNADEQYAYIEGAFGKIQAGQKDGVFAQMAHIAPLVGFAAGDFAAFVPDTGAYNGMQVVDTTLSDDGARVNYISPSLSGFSLGLSFAPNPGGALQANTEAATGQHNEWQAAVAYNGEIGGVGIGADVGYVGSSGNSTEQDQDAWRAGLVVSYAGFAIGGSYMKVDDVNGANNVDLTVWDAGLSYTTGPYAVGLTYHTSDLDTALDEEYQQVILSGSYAMGPGVKLVASGFWAETDVDGTNNDADAYGAIAGLALTF